MAKLILKSPYIKSTGGASGYLKYIATRPRAERLGEHGLFGDDESVSLDSAMKIPPNDFRWYAKHGRRC